MCGRYALTTEPGDLQEAFPEFKFPDLGIPRFNIAPSQPILATSNDGKKKADHFNWGLIPSWAKDPSIGNRMINARADTLAEKPAFRSAYKYRRCLIFADGFFEWQAQPGSKLKIPFFIQLKSRLPFVFAGLWEQWHSTDGSEILSAAIITTEPNELMTSIHNRMPVILKTDAYAHWMDSSPQSPDRLQNLLVPYPSIEMTAYPVSTVVNSPNNDRAECIRPINA